MGVVATDRPRAPSIAGFCAGMSSRDRRRFFTRDENAIAFFGEEVAAAEAKRLKKQLRRLRRESPSDAWVEAVDEATPDRPIQFPPGRPDPTRPHGAAMIVSLISGRYTPPNNLTEEDELDATANAGGWRDIRSPSALAHLIHTVYTEEAIKRIADNAGEVGRGKSTTNGKMHRDG